MGVVECSLKAMDADASKEERKSADEHEVEGSSPEQQSHSVSEPLDPARVSIVHMQHTFLMISLISDPR